MIIKYTSISYIRPIIVMIVFFVKLFKVTKTIAIGKNML